MNDIIESIITKAKNNKKTIVLPEGEDDRILEATTIILKENIANIILIGNKEKILSKNKAMSSIKIIDPHNSNLTNKFIDELYELRKEKGMTKEEAKELLLNDYMYFACMLAKDNYADGVVSGVSHSTSNTLRPALQIIKSAPNTKLVSSFFLMTIPNCEYGEKGTFIFADCGLVQNPNPEELACIAKESADSFKLLVGKDPIVAMLSHSTKGSATHPDVDKVIEATRIANEQYKDYLIDGELQLDAALVKEVAKTKNATSKVAGSANVLIFPDLDSGNIGYKLVERLAKAKAYGPITQGMAKPVNDLSRGSSIEDIVGVIAITAIQVNKGV